MTNFLIKKITKQVNANPHKTLRQSLGKAAGVVGIISNLILAVLKLAIGFFSKSIAIMADAINNLSDCASSVITLVGFKLSAIPADEEHPYGHARFEYLSGLAVSILIVAIGVEFLKSAIDKIINPQPVQFNIIVFIVLILSIIIKLWQGFFNKKIGEEINSTALAATATDSINDVITTSVVLIASLLSYFFGLVLDGWMGLLVAGFIIFSGGKLIIDTINPLIGQAPDKELVETLTKKILSYPAVLGMHDLIIHNYGPGRCFATAHVEVAASEDILVSHNMIDNIERDFAQNLGIALVIHLDPLATDDEKTNELRQEVQYIVSSVDPVLSMHDFRVVMGTTHTNLVFDIVLPPRYNLTDAVIRENISSRVMEINNSFHCVITVDRSYTSTINN